MNLKNALVPNDSDGIVPQIFGCASTMASRKLLVFGATGNTGRRCVEAALLKNWNVVVFVRQPAKVSEVLGAEKAARVTIVEGDLRDAKAIAAVVKSAQPDALIDASSALPFTHKKGQPPNSADRGLMLTSIVESLKDSSRIADCRLILVGGQLLPEPGGTINSPAVWALAFFLKHVVARSMFADAAKFIQYLWDSPPEFRFSMARMGRMSEGPSRGRLVAEETQDNIQRGSVSFTDVGTALVELAGDATGRWDRKALFYNYAKE